MFMEGASPFSAGTVSKTQIKGAPIGVCPTTTACWKLRCKNRTPFVQMLLRVSLRFRTFYLYFSIDSDKIVMLPPSIRNLLFLSFCTCLPQINSKRG